MLSIKITANGDGLAMWRHSAIRQPGLSLNKVTKDDDKNNSPALFVSRN
jgi:hypothetical protein